MEKFETEYPIKVFKHVSGLDIMGEEISRQNGSIVMKNILGVIAEGQGANTKTRFHILVAFGNPEEIRMNEGHISFDYVPDSQYITSYKDVLQSLRSTIVTPKSRIIV